MRFSRGCYDKFHRCPGWAGGGPRYASVDRCDGGRLGGTENGPYEGRLWRLRFQRCNRCDVIVLPYATRWLSVPWLVHELRWQVRDLVYRWRMR